MGEVNAALLSLINEACVNVGDIDWRCTCTVYLYCPAFSVNVSLGV